MSILITAIIPTLCTSERARLLDRAIGSLHASCRVPIKILVIVNGVKFDPVEVRRLHARTDIEVFQLSEGSAPLAAAAGRAAVRTEFFCFLDDDDELLPGALDARLGALRDEPNLDIVISGGWREYEGNLKPMIDGFELITIDPLLALLRSNWLASCGGLFRSASVGSEYFHDPHNYIEWTWLAYRLASNNLRVKGLSEPGFIVHETAASASKTTAYRLAHFGLYERMLKACVREDIRMLIRVRLASAAHDMSEFYLGELDLRSAWRWHLKSIGLPRGWRYLTYTFHLILASVFGNLIRRS